LILSLDANVLIGIINGHPEVRRRYDELIYDGKSAKICVFAAHEVLFGALISRRRVYQEDRARRLFAENALADWTMDDADATAVLRATLRKRGQTIGSIDTLIAGQALARGWTVVTSNTREFARVEGLNVIDWAAQQD
jgi:tRNA(fMet)-specific endonuclease VapC